MFLQLRILLRITNNMNTLMNTQQQWDHEGGGRGGGAQSFGPMSTALSTSYFENRYNTHQ